MKLLAAVISGIAAVSFSSLAAAQAMPADNTGLDADVHTKAKVKKDRKRTKEDASADASANASAGGSASANTGANGRDNSNASSPSRNSGTPGHMSQGSVHNDEGKK